MKKLLWMLLCMLTLSVATVDAAAKKKVHTIGDSTMDGTYDPATTYKRGWCMMLQQFLNSDNLAVNNRGKSGASSKSFYKESAYWPTLVKGGRDEMQAGDILLIQFAHNDEKNGGADGDDVKAYYTAQGNTATANSTDYRGTVANTTYKEFIRKYINEAKAMGVKPIVVGAICRKYFGSDGKITRSGRHDLGDKFTICDGKSVYKEGNKVAATDHTYDYPYQSSLVAAEYDDVPYIDLTALTAELYQSYGDSYCTTNLFGPDDSTHPAALGATLISRAFAQGVKSLYESEEYAKPENAAKKAVLKELYDNLVLSNDISFNPTSGDMGEAYVGMNLTKEFNISAFGLAAETGKFTISVSEGFKVSTDKQTWKDAVEVEYTGATLITSVYVRANIAAPGAMNGTLTATDGTNTKTLDLTCSGISLTGGEETTCTWALNSTSLAATSQMLTGLDVKTSGMTVTSNLATPDSPAGHGKMLLFNIDGGTWPAGDIDEVSTRYIQFQATVPSDKEFNMDKISFDVIGWGGNSVCYHAYYATKPDFSDQVLLGENLKMTNKAAVSISKDVVAKLEEGESIYIRVYPWLSTSSAATGKYIGLSDVTIHGVMSEAGGESLNVEGSISYTLVDSDPVLTPEQMNLGFVGKTVTYGELLTVSEKGGNSWSGSDGSRTQTKVYNGSGASLPGSPSDGNTITYTLSPEDGMVFIPTKLSFNAARYGTDGGTITAVVEATGSSTICSNEGINRSGKSLPLKNISGEVSGVVADAVNPLKIKISVLGLGNTKSVGIDGIVLEGKLTGTIQGGTKYYLNTSVSPEGAGTITLDPVMDQYKEGKEVTMTAQKNFGYKFQKWTVNGTDYSTDATTTIKMDEEKNVVAVFETIPVYTVETIVKNDLDIADMGSITITPNENNGKFEEGTEISLKAETSKILKFQNWEDNSTENPRSITVDKDITVTANYEIQDFIAVFDASKAQAYDYSGNGFNADVTWDANRNASCKVVKVSDGSGVYTNDGKTVGTAGTPVVRNREGVVIAGINGLYQNGYRTSDIAWQYQFSTQGFTSAKFVGDMAAKNAANTTYKAQYSLDGNSFTDITGAEWNVTANVVNPVEFALPEDAVGKDLVYVRITGTGSATFNSSYPFDKQFLGLDYCDHSESGVGNVFVLGDAVTAADEVAPKVVNTIPAASATGISASGNIVVTFDEKIQLSGRENCVATLNGEALTPVLSSKSVSFQYVNMPYGKTCTFTMPAGYIEDKSGNAADAVEFSFTIMDRQKPQARIYDAVVDKTLNLDYGQSIPATATMPKQYRYIQDAINDAPAAGTKPYLIYIKEGYYDDPNPYFNDSYGQRYDLTQPDGTYAGMTNYKVINNSVNGNGTDKSDPSKKYDDCRLIFINKPNVHLIGQATDKVTIATDRMAGGDLSRPEKVWYHVNAGAAVEILAKGSDALLSTLTIDNENWTKEKKAGPQALCLNTDADRLVFNELNVQSYQDDYKCSGTYNRAFWFKSRFEGSVDYIYGDCDVWFEQCVQDINRDKGGYIVAPSHPLETRWGYVFNNNTIMSSLYGDNCQVYLGRPWHNYPKTVFMNTQVKVKTYEGYWAENMGGLPALWAVKNLTDKNGTAMSEASRSSYYADQAEGYFAPGTYTSKVDLGNGKFRFTNANTKNSLTDEEFAQYTIQNVLSGDKSTGASGYWNPLFHVEKTATPEVTVNGNLAEWTADEYAICYVVSVAGKPVAFVTENYYEGTEADVVTVQSVNEHGVLSVASKAVTLASSTAVVGVKASATGATVNGIYSVDGKKMPANAGHGVYIQNGKKVVK